MTLHELEDWEITFKSNLKQLIHAQLIIVFFWIKSTDSTEDKDKYSYLYNLGKLRVFGVNKQGKAKIRNLKTFFNHTAKIIIFLRLVDSICGSPADFFQKLIGEN